jgi:hypothetical protein
MVTCLNCGKRYTGKYCSECGQKATAAKLTWKSVMEEFVHFFTHLEHSFVYTSKRLITQPGAVMKDFLDGKRKLIHKPITFLLIWAAINSLIKAFYTYCTSQFDLYRFEDAPPSLRILWSGYKNPILAANENWASLLVQAPMLVLLGWLIFRKTRTNFIERWVIIIYGLSATMMLAVVMNTATFLLRLAQVPLSKGNINDGYFLCYQLMVTWIVYSFQKVYRPRMPEILKIITAFVLALVGNYASDIAFYLLYRFSA